MANAAGTIVRVNPTVRRDASIVIASISSSIVKSVGYDETFGQTRYPVAETHPHTDDPIPVRP